jgi:ABC-type multidrug transport system permease subunit
MKIRTLYTYRLKVIFSDKWFILAFLIIPLLLALVTGHAQRKEKLGYVPIVIVDEDETEDSIRFCNRLAQKEGFQVHQTDRETAMNTLKQDRAEVMVIIEEGFSEHLASGKLENTITLIKSPSTYSAEMMKEIVGSEALRIYSGYFAYQWITNSFEGKDMQVSLDKVKDRVEAYWEPKPLMTITYEELEVTPQTGTSISVPSFTAASMGLLVLFIMMGILFGSSWLCEEKANGTLQRILSVDGATLPLFAANIGALSTIGLLLTGIFEIVQCFIFKTALLQGALSWLVMLGYILCASAMSMLIAALLNTPHQLQAFVPVFALITGVLGGCLWNLLGVPSQLLKLALLTPQGWALQALTNLYAAPRQWGLALPALMIFLGLAIIFLVLAVRRYKRAVRI